MGADRFYRGSIMVALADVQHIEFWVHQGEPRGIRIITAHTRWNFEQDNWDNNAYLPQDEVDAFIDAWGKYMEAKEEPVVELALARPIDLPSLPLRGRS